MFSFLRGSPLGKLVSRVPGELAQSRMTVECYKAPSNEVPELKNKMAHTLLSALHSVKHSMHQGTRDSPAAQLSQADWLLT